MRRIPCEAVSRSSGSLPALQRCSHLLETRAAKATTSTEPAGPPHASGWVFTILVQAAPPTLHAIAGHDARIVPLCFFFEALMLVQRCRSRGAHRWTVASHPVPAQLAAARGAPSDAAPRTTWRETLPQVPARTAPAEAPHKTRRTDAKKMLA